VPRREAHVVTAAPGESLWGSQQLDLGAYLQRTGYRGPLEPSAAALQELHRCHVASVPFENLDIMLGRAIELDIANLQAKLVGSRRGGYCFEHNLLFAAVLERVGFSFTGLSARVTMGAEMTSRPMSHMCLCVQAGGGRWLADVGFGGDGLLEPLPVEQGATVCQGSASWEYRLADLDGGTWALESKRTDGWLGLYVFTFEPRWPIDYRVFNWYTSTHPRSAFTSRVIAQKAGDDARVSLIGDELTITRAGWEREVRTVRGPEVIRILRDEFGLSLAPAEIQLLVKARAL
jgi:N-hydroxyarylamine O-acetyltransferase